MDEHYQKHVLDREEVVRNLQLQGEAEKEDAEAKNEDDKAEEDMTEEEKERRDMMMKKLEEMQSASGGVGTSKRQLGFDLNGDKLEDKYGMDKEVDIYAKDDEDDVQN